MYLFFVDWNYVDTNYCWQYSTYDLAAYFASVIKIATELQLCNFPPSAFWTIFTIAIQ